ncbi:MAG: DUF3592 domain-containing protein [Oscillospiraceae bacterium]|nr:DUF3592 domain-containing protein [Oscillospiraceae bacterium]
MKRKKSKTKEKPRPKTSPIAAMILGLVFCAAFLVFGSAMIFVSSELITDKMPCTAETTGTVTNVYVKSKTAYDSKHRRYLQSTYTTDYTYELNGKTLNDTFRTSKYIYKGKIIRIRYDPDDPDHKYIKGYDDAGDLIPLIFGIVWDALFLFIIYAIIVSIKYETDKKKEAAQKAAAK